MTTNGNAKDAVSTLVMRARAGDAGAFDALVARFQDRAVGYARALLNGDPASAEDAAQDAFVLAWRDLPHLEESQAFPSWLRRIVFTACDRIRRTRRVRVVALDCAWHIAGNDNPFIALSARNDAARIRTALIGLPEHEREAAFQYYLGGQDLGEIAEFLGVPRTTVKNRLHSARKRLRKELWEMAEEVLATERPSRTEEFAGKVLVRRLEEFRQQQRADPHTADRQLLIQARRSLEELLTRAEALDWETVRAGFGVLQRLNDHAANAALLTRYLSQPSLSDSQTAWTYFHLSNHLACHLACLEGDTAAAAGAVLASDAFEHWLPGRRVRLAFDWPYEPVAEGGKGLAFEGESEIWQLFLGKSGEFASAWRSVWRENDYLAKVDAALATAPNYSLPAVTARFICLRMACHLCETLGWFDRARHYIDRMYTLSDDPLLETDSDRAYWRVKALGHAMNWARKTGDKSAVDARAAEMLELLTAYPDEDWASGQRHDLAHYLTLEGRDADALPLLEQNVARGGHCNAWGYVIHAAAVWRVTQDRAQTLSLLRDAAVRDPSDMTDSFRSRAEFTEVKDDPEFLAAIKRPA